MLDNNTIDIFHRAAKLEVRKRQIEEELENIKAQQKEIAYSLSKQYMLSGSIDELPSANIVDDGLTATLRMDTSYAVPSAAKAEFIKAIKADNTFEGLLYETWSFAKLNALLNDIVRQDGKIPESIRELVNAFVEPKISFRKMTELQKEKLKKKNII